MSSAEPTISIRTLQYEAKLMDLALDSSEQLPWDILNVLEQLTELLQCGPEMSIAA